jgi:hypothetical protein
VLAGVGPYRGLIARYHCLSYHCYPVWTLIVGHILLYL